jgi:hypothetical protein
MIPLSDISLVFPLFPLEYSPFPNISLIEEGNNRSLWNLEQQSVSLFKIFLVKSFSYRSSNSFFSRDGHHNNE